MTSLRARQVPVSAVSAADARAMFDLMDASYENVVWSEFQADLADKDWVLLLRSSGGELAGFSTQKCLLHPFEGERHRIVFSGDTVIAREHRGSRALAWAFGRLMLGLLETDPGTPLHWLLISKGLRTYRYLPLYFGDFSPRFDRPTPQGRARLMASLGERLFPGRFDRARGVVAARPDGQRLRAEDSSARARPCPHRDFFFRSNPGHRRGDELLCLAPFEPANLAAAIRRRIEHELVHT